MKKWLLAVIFASILALAACGGGDSGDTEEPSDTGSDTEEPADDGATEGEDDGDGESTVDASEAEGLYKKSCQSCHAADLSGANGPDLTEVGARLSSEEIETIINEGAPGMPPGLVGEDESKVLSDWLADKK